MSDSSSKSVDLRLIQQVLGAMLKSPQALGPADARLKPESIDGQTKDSTEQNQKTLSPDRGSAQQRHKKGWNDDGKSEVVLRDRAHVLFDDLVNNGDDKKKPSQELLLKILDDIPEPVRDKILTQNSGQALGGVLASEAEFETDQLELFDFEDDDEQGEESNEQESESDEDDETVSLKDLARHGSAFVKF